MNSSQRSPSRFSARVADFNDNLFYDMQEIRGIQHLLLQEQLHDDGESEDSNSGTEDIQDEDKKEEQESLSSSSSSYRSSGLSCPSLSSSSSSLESSVAQFEGFLSCEEYLGSFLTTESTIPQPPHVDYSWEVLEEHFSSRNNDDEDHDTAPDLMIGFFPLTNEGMFLQIWPTCPDRQDTSTIIEGQLIFIPYGKLLLLPANTIHAGGFRSERPDRGCGPYGNLRFHLYIAKGGRQLPDHQTNKYTEPSDRRKELSDRYIDAPYLPDLIDGFFV